MRQRILVILLMFLPLMGCASTSDLSVDELARPEFDGPPLSAAKAEADIRERMETRLFDPYSAVYRFSPPYKGKVWGGIVYGGWNYGYVVPFTVNAKNRMGGYVGVRPYKAVFKDGELDRVW